MSAKTKPLKDEGSRLEVVAAGATAGLVSRYVPVPVPRTDPSPQHHH